MSAQPAPAQQPFTNRQAREARQHYQHLAFIVNRMVNQIIAGLDDLKAAKFKPSVFQTIHSLHGMFNGQDLTRKALFRAHMFTAQHFDHKGSTENAEKLVGRRLNDLRDAERACGLHFFKITRADGIKQVLTSYEAHYLLDAAEWLYLQARSQPGYWSNPAKAITDDLLDAAIATLPEMDEDRAGDDERERELTEGSSITDSDVIKGQWTKIFNNVRANLERATAAGSNPLIEAEQAARELRKIAQEIYADKCDELERARRKIVQRNFYERGTDDDGVVDGYKYGGQDEADGELEEVVIEAATPPMNVPPTPDEVAVNQQVSETQKTENPFSLLEWALRWASQGIAVFPVHTAFDGICSCSRGSECRSIGKHPRTLNGLKEATTDPAQIRRWWQKWPDANIGGATGGAIRLLVVDVDPKSGGDASLCDLTEAHGQEWLNTLHIETGSRGSHFFYTYPPEIELRNTASKLAPGIDTRASGGYVVLPPSIHVSGRQYTIKEAAEMQSAPLWLVETLTRAPGELPAKVIDFQERRARPGGSAVFAEGERNDGLFRVACAIWGSGGAKDITDLHMQALQVNAERCSPTLTDAEVAQVVGSVARYPRGVPIREGATA
jgi:putative DNA primase/helicase